MEKLIQRGETSLALAFGVEDGPFLLLGRIWGCKTLGTL
jgi:hypothetical protein